MNIQGYSTVELKSEQNRHDLAFCHILVGETDNKARKQKKINELQIVIKRYLEKNKTWY